MDTKHKLFDAATTAGCFVSNIRAAEATGISTSMCTERGVENL